MLAVLLAVAAADTYIPPETQGSAIHLQKLCKHMPMGAVCQAF